jgi:hypothetical protein
MTSRSRFCVRNGLSCPRLLKDPDRSVPRSDSLPARVAAAARVTVFHHAGEDLELLGRDVPVAVRHLLRALDHEPLPVLQRLHKKHAFISAS